MITSKQAAECVTKIYNPVDSGFFDKVVTDYGITFGLKTIGDTLVIATPGSQSNRDFYLDIKSISDCTILPNTGLVVDSFYRGLEHVVPLIMDDIEKAKKLAFTGHSLGCTRIIYLVNNLINKGRKIETVHLFAPPLCTDIKTIKNIVLNTERVCAFKNGSDPIVKLPGLLKYLAQFPLIKINESPGWLKRWIDINWHLMRLYTLGVNGL